MFGKLFASMFDGSLHGHWEATVTLQQMVILSNRHGEVDMTAEAIAARTGIPLPILRKGIAELAEPDPQSRGPAEDGRRIVPLSPGRSWGWRIVNYLFYRTLASAEDKREGARERQRRHRDSSVTPGHALSRVSRHADAEADAKAKTKKKHADPRFRLVRAGCDVPGHVPPFAALPLKGGRLEAVLETAHLDELQAAYPRVPIGPQLLRMRQWLVGNPGRCKTARGVLRFVDSWLKGEAEALEREGRKGSGARKQSDDAYAMELKEARRG